MPRNNLVVIICSLLSAIVIVFALYSQLHWISDHSQLGPEEKKDEYLRQLIHIITILPALLGLALFRKDVGKMITTGYVVYLAIIGFCYYFLLHGNDALESGILMITLGIPFSIALSIFSIIRLFQQRHY